jgi:hypothetical protein
MASRGSFAEDKTVDEKEISESNKGIKKVKNNSNLKSDSHNP